MTERAALKAHLATAQHVTANLGKPPNGDHEYLLCIQGQWLRYTATKAWSIGRTITH